MWHLCSNCFTKHHCIRVFHHFMGDRVPWHHLQGLHVALVTIVPLAQTPQLFQFLSAQNSEYVTLFSFCKKLFCMKKSQQIKAIFLKKRACEWRCREFRAGPLSGSRSSSAIPPAGWWHRASRSHIHSTANAGTMLALLPEKTFMDQTTNLIYVLEMSYSVTGGLPSAATQAGR